MMRAKRRRISKSDSGGFTLIELIVSLALVSAVLLAIGKFQSDAFQFNQIFSRQVRLRTDARRVLSEMVDEIRMMTISEEGVYPLLLAQDTAVTFYADYDNDGIVERIRYFASDGKLWKGTLEPTGNPLTYNDANEVVEEKLSFVQTTTPIFQFFDGNFQGGSGQPPSGPNSIDLRLRTDTNAGNEEESLDDVEVLCNGNPSFTESFGSTDTTTVAGWTETENNADDAQIRTSSPLSGSPTPGHLRLEEGAQVVRNIPTAGCTRIDLRYYWRGDNSAESGEYIYLEWRDPSVGTWNLIAQHEADPPGCSWFSCPWSSQENRNIFGGGSTNPVESARHIRIRLELDEDPNRYPAPVVLESSATMRNLKDNF